MNPYIGDRPIDPPEVYECEYCDGFDEIYRRDGTSYPCPECQGDTDPGEPNEEPDL